MIDLFMWTCCISCFSWASTFILQ